MRMFGAAIVIMIVVIMTLMVMIGMIVSGMIVSCSLGRCPAVRQPDRIAERLDLLLHRRPGKRLARQHRQRPARQQHPGLRHAGQPVDCGFDLGHATRAVNPADAAFYFRGLGLGHDRAFRITHDRGLAPLVARGSKGRCRNSGKLREWLQLSLVLANAVFCLRLEILELGSHGHSRNNCRQIAYQRR